MPFFVNKTSSYGRIFKYFHGITEVCLIKNLNRYAGALPKIIDVKTSKSTQLFFEEITDAERKT